MGSALMASFPSFAIKFWHLRHFRDGPSSALSVNEQIMVAFIAAIPLTCRPLEISLCVHREACDNLRLCTPRCVNARVNKAITITHYGTSTHHRQENPLPACELAIEDSFQMILYMVAYSD